MHIFMFIPFLLVDAYNDSDVIITHAGHSEVELPPPVEKVELPPPVGKTTEKPHVYEPTEDSNTADVIFVPNEKPLIRNEDFYNSQPNVNLATVKNIDATESQGVIFLSGKNNENVEKPIKVEKEVHGDVIRVSGKEKYKNVPKRGKETKELDCSNVNCNNTLNSVCGRREDEGKIKFRLFLNECYLRKVNCGFKYEINRYTTVGMENCRSIGVHTANKPQYYKPSSRGSSITGDELKQDTRRSFLSRRSSSMGIDGRGCYHLCPFTCTEDYDPQCALSNSGHKKVFLNHCKLDYHSCLHETIWHLRPLSECVGGKKADIRQNRGFIGWMQRIGIVDRKGRITLR